MTAKRLMALSLLFAAVGTAILLLSKGNTKSLSPSEPIDTSISVLVANQDIKPGQAYTTNAFRWQTITEAELEQYVDYISRDTFNPSQLKSGVAYVAMNKGQIISLADITKPKGSFSLANKVRDGYRAVSVPVDQVTANSGFIQPGDNVDILLLGSKTNELKKYDNLVQGLYVSTIATGVKVLAFNDLDSSENFQEKRRDYGAEIPKNSSVSLEVLPEQAAQIVLANQLGKLTLSLRSTIESETVAPPSDPYTETSSLINPSNRVIAPDVGLVQLRPTNDSKKK